MRYGISAAALIVQHKHLLLVNHRKSGQYDFWLPPGGKLQGNESIFDCARREVMEETGLSVELDRIVYIVEYTQPDYHFCKFFIRCKKFTGTLTLVNREPEETFLVDARFLAKADLQKLDVRPAILQDRFWDDLEAGLPETRYLGLEEMRFKWPFHSRELSQRPRSKWLPPHTLRRPCSAQLSDVSPE